MGNQHPCSYKGLKITVIVSFKGNLSQVGKIYPTVPLSLF